MVVLVCSGLLYDRVQPGYCSAVVCRQDSSLNFDKTHITPSDFTALGYVISTASKHVSKIRFERCTWDNDGLMAFSSEITTTKLHSIKSLEVSTYLSENYKAINALLCQLPCLEELSVLELSLREELMFIVLLEVFNFLNLDF